VDILQTFFVEFLVATIRQITVTFKIPISMNWDPCYLNSIQTVINFGGGNTPNAYNVDDTTGWPSWIVGPDSITMLRHAALCRPRLENVQAARKLAIAQSKNGYAGYDTDMPMTGLMYDILYNHTATDPTHCEQTFTFTIAVDCLAYLTLTPF
jgi:hypothetical protein